MEVVENKIEELVRAFGPSNIYSWKILQLTLKNKLHNITNTDTEHSDSLGIFIPPNEMITPKELETQENSTDQEKSSDAKSQGTLTTSEPVRKPRIFSSYFTDLEKIKNTEFYKQFIDQNDVYPTSFILYYEDDILYKVPVLI